MSTWLSKHNTLNAWDNSYQEHWLIKLTRAMLARAIDDLTSETIDRKHFDCAKRWLLLQPTTFKLCAEVLNFQPSHLVALRDFAELAQFETISSLLMAKVDKLNKISETSCRESSLARRRERDRLQKQKSYLREKARK